MALSAPTLGYQLWQSTQNRQQAVARASTRVEELAKLAAVEEEDSLQEASNLLRVLKHVPAIANAATEECHFLLRAITNEHPRVALISVERADGSVACTSAQSVPPTFSLADRAWFKEATAADAPETVVSALLIARTTGSPGVVVASGLSPSDSDGARGSVSALMNLAWFSEIATKLSGSTGASILIVDARDGAILAQSAVPGSVPGRQFVSTELIRAFENSPSGTLEAESLTGETEIVGYRRLPADQGSHSTVLVSLRKATVVANSNRQLLYAMLTTAAALLCGLAAAWCVAEASIVRPLSSLARMAARLSGGDLDARVIPQQFTVVELTILGNTLNRAVEQLQLRDCELEQLTLRDPLTGLANRRCFDTALKREWARAERINSSLALFMVDVDYFKRYNDTYGHLAGDECLRSIASAIAGRARSAFDVVARYGGEEFALLVPNIDYSDAMEMADRVVAEVRELQLPHLASPTRWISVSVGFATLAPGSQGAVPLALIEAADRALYEAKRRGRNRAVYANELVPIPEMS